MPGVAIVLTRNSLPDSVNSPSATSQPAEVFREMSLRTPVWKLEGNVMAPVASHAARSCWAIAWPRREIASRESAAGTNGATTAGRVVVADFDARGGLGF